jgi:hypothetical protein
LSATLVAVYFLNIPKLVGPFAIQAILLLLLIKPYRILARKTFRW